jgi:hypothetical protein
MGDHKSNPFARGGPPLISPDVRDGFNRVLHRGDLVTLAQPIGLTLFRVVDISPNLDPTAPAGTMKVFLRADVPMVVRTNQPTQALVRLLSAEEAGIVVEAHEPQQQAEAGLNAADSPPEKDGATTSVVIPPTE